MSFCLYDRVEKRIVREKEAEKTMLLMTATGKIVVVPRIYVYDIVTGFDRSKELSLIDVSERYGILHKIGNG